METDGSSARLLGLLVGGGFGLVAASITGVLSPWYVLAGAPLGAMYVLGFSVQPRSWLDHAVLATALAVPTGTALYILGIAVSGGEQAWTAAQVGRGLPAIAAWAGAGIVFGVLLSVLSKPLTARFAVQFDPDPERGRPSADPAEEPTRIVILGGGFAGFYAARRLEDLFGPDQSVELTLISRTNAVLFTPMLAEVVGGSLDPTAVATPLRTGLRRTDVTRAEVLNVDHHAKQVTLEAPSYQRQPTRPAASDGGNTAEQRTVSDDTATRERGTPSGGDQQSPGSDPAHHHAGNGTGMTAEDAAETVPYDHLVVAVGSVTDYKGLDGVAEFAFEFKTLQDAIQLRSHVITCFEQANRTSDAATRRSLLRFVIAGGGFAGAELAGALNDFVHELISYYPRIPPEDVEVTLVHSGERIMPELSDSLAEYALERMRERGVQFRLGSYVEAADPATGTVSLTGDETLTTETLVWTAGIKPNPLVNQFDLPTERGGLVAEPDFSVPGGDGLWAVGDCARVANPATGEPFPPTAEFAVRAGSHLAENLHAAVTDGEPEPMTYRSRGSLAVIGHQTACAELGRWQTSGLFAWVLWRAVYLFKLPGAERKLRVAVTWLAELFFPRDIVQTFDDRTREVLSDAD